MAKTKKPGKSQNQPDFGVHFHTDAPTPIDYESRSGPNLCHDIVYLASYIHDARFKIEHVKLHRTTLTIPLERDRWELYKSRGRLGSVKSHLTICPALSILWELSGPLTARGGISRVRELFVKDLYLGESYWEDENAGEVVLSNRGIFKLRIRVFEPFVIRLTDLARKSRH